MYIEDIPNLFGGKVLVWSPQIWGHLYEKELAKCSSIGQNHFEMSLHRSFVNKLMLCRKMESLYIIFLRTILFHILSRETALMGTSILFSMNHGGNIRKVELLRVVHFWWVYILILTKQQRMTHSIPDSYQIYLIKYTLSSWNPLHDEYQCKYRLYSMKPNSFFV